MLGFIQLDGIAVCENEGPGKMELLEMSGGLTQVNAKSDDLGGAEDNVMIFDESGGAAKTYCLCAALEASSYFKKASLENGPGVRMLGKAMTGQRTELVLMELCFSKDNWGTSLTS